MKFKLINIYGCYATTTEKVGLLKPHDSIKRPRVRSYGLISFLCISWNSSGGLTKGLGHYSFKTTLILIIIVSTGANHTKNYFSTLNFDVLRHPPYSSGMVIHHLHSFHSRQHLLAENVSNDVEEVGTCLN